MNGEVNQRRFFAGMREKFDARRVYQRGCKNCGSELDEEDYIRRSKTEYYCSVSCLNEEVTK